MIVAGGMMAFLKRCREQLLTLLNGEKYGRMMQTRVLAKRTIELSDHEYQLILALRRDFRPFDVVDIRLSQNQNGTAWSATLIKGYREKEQLLLKIDVMGNPASTFPAGK